MLRSIAVTLKKRQRGIQCEVVVVDDEYLYWNFPLMHGYRATPSCTAPFKLHSHLTSRGLSTYAFAYPFSTSHFLNSAASLSLYAALPLILSFTCSSVLS